jgi:glycosyltransferase involved in cell wall biosynthesis
MTDSIHPLFSVTIPAYKAQYLAECLDSILAQSYANFEVVIVNDASPQNLDEIVERYNDERIRYFKNEKNCGALHVVDNWNKCLSYVKGDYVICMGDDDKLLPNCLEEYAKLIKKYPGLNVYHALTEVIDEHSQFMRMQEMRPEREGLFSMIYGRLNNRRLQYIGDWLFHTDFLRSIGGFVNFPFAWGSDDMTAYLAAKEKGVANSQVPMFQYRESSVTITRSGNYGMKYESMTRLVTMLKEFVNNKSLATSELEALYQQSCKPVVARTEKDIKDSFISNDIISCGKFSRGLWWMLHSGKIGATKSMVLKNWLKSLNK